QRLGLDSRRFEAEIGRQGVQRLTLTYQQIPRNLFDDGVTPFVGTGAGRLDLPPDWQVTGPTTTEMISLEDHLRDFDLRQRRRTLSLDYRRNLGAGWQLDGSLRREVRDGDRQLAGTIGTNGGNARAALLPAGVDFESDDVELGLCRQGERHQLGFAYHGSWFRNADRSLNWQNPFGQQPQWQPGTGFPDGRGQLALVPDNRFQQLRAFTQLSVSPTMRLSLDLARGRLEQDQSFLPYTVNPNLAAPAALPRASLDGRVDTTVANLRITARPLPRLNLVGRIRHQERDNRTPRDLYLGVSGDAGDQATVAQGRINRPYSLTRRDLSLDASYRLPQRTRLTAGYENRLRQRDYSEVNATREHVFRAGIRSERLGFVSLAADAHRERRDAGRYLGNRPLLATRLPGTVDAEDFDNHPLLRKHYLAERDRDGVQLRADVYPHDRVHLGAAFIWNRDSYDDERFGLNASRVRSWLLDAGYARGDNLHLAAYYHRDRYDNEQSGRAFTAAPPTVGDPRRNWFVDSQDNYHTFGANLDLKQVNGALPWLQHLGLGGMLDLAFEAMQSRSRGDIAPSAGPALSAAPLPDHSTRLNRYRVEARYPFSAASSLKLAWEHERYRSSDFALDDVAADTVANVLLFGESSPRYRANWVTLSLLHRLGR
ncbi:MAG: MtrB/PioB family decaheme-associated outer membrane protein, partial [Pseudomonadales bacterium]